MYWLVIERSTYIIYSKKKKIISETTSTNPQFRIRVPSGHPAKAHVVVAVSQKYECYRSRTNEEEYIGFTIYEVPPGIVTKDIQHIQIN